MCSNTAVLMKERLWALLARHEVDRQGQASSPEQRKRVTRVDLDLACAGWRHGIKGTPAARHKHTTLTAPVQEHAEGYGTCSSCIGQGLLCAAVVCGVPLRRTKCTARQRRRAPTKPLLSCGGIYHREGHGHQPCACPCQGSATQCGLVRGQEVSPHRARCSPSADSVGVLAGAAPAECSNG